MPQPSLCRVFIKNVQSCGAALRTPSPVSRPDLRIYSQADRFSNGQTVSWDSPDIGTWVSRQGVARTRDSFSIRAHNDSQTVGAHNALIHCDWSEFGIGTTWQRLASQQSSFGAGEVKNLTVPVPEELRVPERFIRARVDLVHPSDANESNNSGAQGVRPVRMAEFSSRVFSDAFPIENHTETTQNLSLHIFTHDTPFPATVDVQPLQLVLAAGETGTVEVIVTLNESLPDNFPPGGVGARFTITAQHAGANLVDGVTYALTP